MCALRPRALAAVAEWERWGWRWCWWRRWSWVSWRGEVGRGRRVASRRDWRNKSDAVVVFACNKCICLSPLLIFTASWKYFTGAGHRAGPEREGERERVWLIGVRSALFVYPTSFAWSFCDINCPAARQAAKTNPSSTAPLRILQICAYTCVSMCVCNAACKRLSLGIFDESLRVCVA